MGSSTVTCPICSKKYRCLNGHITRGHGISMDTFWKRYPDAEVQSKDFIECASKSRNKTLRARSAKERQAFSEKMSKIMVDRFSKMSDAERHAWSLRSRKNMKQFIASMSSEELTKYRKRASQRAKTQDLTKFQESGRAAWAERYNSMTTEEHDEYCSRLSEAQKNRFREMTQDELNEHIKRTNGKDTSKIEKRAIESLRGLGYKVQTKKKIDSYEVDAFLPDLNLVVEIDGDYWHGGPKLFVASDYHPTTGQRISEIRQRDCRRARKIRALGYMLVRVWESDLLNFGFTAALKSAIQDNTEPSLSRKGSEGVTTEARGYRSVDSNADNGSPARSNSSRRARDTLKQLPMRTALG